MSNQELDKKIEAIYIDWEHGKRPYSGMVKDVKALIRSELDAVMPEQMGLPDTLGTAYWNGAIAQFAQNRKARGL